MNESNLLNQIIKLISDDDFKPSKSNPSKRIDMMITCINNQSYLAQFGFAELAVLDMIDAYIEPTEKETYFNVAIKMSQDELKPLQDKIDVAIYELRHEDSYTATDSQKAFVEHHKESINLYSLLSSKADNTLLSNYLLINKQMPVTQEFRNHLHTNGHDELVQLVDKCLLRQKIETNLKPSINKQKNLSHKLKI